MVGRPRRISRPKLHNSFLDLVGCTPLVRLSRVAADVPALLSRKFGMLNPEEGHRHLHATFSGGYDGWGTSA